MTRNADGGRKMGRPGATGRARQDHDEGWRPVFSFPLPLRERAVSGEAASRVRGRRYLDGSRRYPFG